MAKKIMIDAGHFSGYNVSKVHKAYNEGNAMWTLHNLLKKELESYGFIVGTTRTNRDKDVAVVERGKLAKGYDLFLSLHSNACDTESVDRAVIIKGYNMDNKLSDKLGQALTSVMGLKQKHQIMVRKNDAGKDYYGVLRGADSVNVKNRILIEHGFHTNTATAKWLCVEANLKKIAEAEAKVIAEYFGVKKATTSTTNTSTSNTTKTYFRVICGSYTERANAETMQKKLEKAGFSSFLEAVNK